MKVDVRELQNVGHDLHGPECVLCTESGVLFVSDSRGGVTRIDADGIWPTLAGRCADLSEPLNPNGIALCRDGTFLIAHLGKQDGGVFRLAADGSLSPALVEVDGITLPPTNFVLVDGRDRFWVTVSTHKRPRTAAYRPGDGDGFVVVVDAKGARIVADGIRYTNELKIHPSRSWVYVNETFGRRLLRYRLHEDGRLSDCETVTEFGEGVFLDGLAFDSLGGAWVTSVVSNQVIRVAPDGSQQVVLADRDEDHIAWVERAFQERRADRTHIGKKLPGRLPNLTSIAFGGSGLAYGYLGCWGDHIYRFKTDIPGAPLDHWAHTPPRVIG